MTLDEFTATVKDNAPGCEVSAAYITQRGIFIAHLQRAQSVSPPIITSSRSTKQEVQSMAAIALESLQTNLTH